MLALAFKKLQPCSVNFINTTEFKIYIFLIIINIAGVLCYFIGLQWTVIVASVLIFIYVVFTFISSIKIMDNFNKISSNKQSDELVKETFKKQRNYF